MCGPEINDPIWMEWEDQRQESGRQRETCHSTIAKDRTAQGLLAMEEWWADREA